MSDEDVKFIISLEKSESNIFALEEKRSDG